MSFPTHAYSLDYARKLDHEDALNAFREQFYIPERMGKPVIYFCGNSLGLQPRSTAKYIEAELLHWAKKGVDGHFEGALSWVNSRKRSKPLLAKLMGAKEEEVVAMNSLSANLHLLLVSFYRPQPKKFKILTEAGAFPSDRYILASQASFHGYRPEEAIIEISPRPGEHTLRTEDILEQINLHKESLTLIMMSGVQYYTGQYFNMKAISTEARRFDIKVGFDLAHAVGNVPLSLHDWQVDFATWCSYKYLNAGPGNVSGIFVHQKHAKDFDIPRFAGWWGNQEEDRFLMKKKFNPMSGADGWLLSNDNVLGLAAHQAALEIFEQAGMQNIRKKSELLTGYLEFLIQTIGGNSGLLEIITPSKSTSRGCQLSLLIHKGGKAVFEEWSKAGVVADWRDPNVIRLAPVPLYNTFEEVFRFGKILETSLVKNH